MIPLVFDLGVSELLIILAVVLLLFGGTRLAGLGKSAARALREFKEETSGLGSEEKVVAAEIQQPVPGRPRSVKTSSRGRPTHPSLAAASHISSRRVPTKIPPAPTCAATPRRRP